jgi:hypothetical protein
MKTLLSIFIVCVLFFGCKKYPEDEQFINLKTPENRLAKYTLWRLTKYTVDGADSIPYINSKVWSGFPLDKIEFDFKETDRKDPVIKINSIGGTSLIYIKFVDRKRKLSIAFNPTTSGYTYPLFLSGWNDWEISKLENGIFIIDLTKNLKKYHIEFRKV